MLAQDLVGVLAKERSVVQVAALAVDLEAAADLPDAALRRMLEPDDEVVRPDVLVLHQLVDAAVDGRAGDVFAAQRGDQLVADLGRDPGAEERVQLDLSGLAARARRVRGVLRDVRVAFIPFQALISRWFDRRRGIALSILGAGFSLGGVVVVPVMRLAIDSLGWETAFVLSGLTVAGVFLPLGLLLVRNSPADIGSTVEGAVARGTVETESDHDDLTVGQALRTPNFWVLGVGLLLFFFGLFGFLVHQVPFYESVGVSRGTAAAIVSITAALGLVSRLAFGLVADRIARFEVAVVAMAASLAAGTTALLLDSGPLGIAVFIIFWVFGTGGGPIMEALIITRTFGLASFATILGALVIVENVGLVASPSIAGAIFDATGSYDWALVLFTGTFVGSGALFVLASRLPRPQRRAVAGTSR